MLEQSLEMTVHIEKATQPLRTALQRITGEVIQKVAIQVSERFLESGYILNEIHPGAIACVVASGVGLLLAVGLVCYVMSGKADKH